MNDEEFRAANERADRAIAAVQRAVEDGTYHPAMLEPFRAAQEAVRALAWRARAETERSLDALAAVNSEAANATRAVLEEIRRLNAAGRHDEARPLLGVLAQAAGFDPLVPDAMVERVGAKLH